MQICLVSYIYIWSWLPLLIRKHLRTNFDMCYNCFKHIGTFARSILFDLCTPYKMYQTQIINNLKVVFLILVNLIGLKRVWWKKYLAEGVTETFLVALPVVTKWIKIHNTMFKIVWFLVYVRPFEEQKNKKQMNYYDIYLAVKSKTKKNGQGPQNLGKYNYFYRPNGM